MATRTPYYARSAQAIRVIDLLTSLMEGALRVPRFERGYLWKQSQRLALFDSIYRGYPIGALLVWRVAGQTLAPCEQVGDLPVFETPSMGGGEGASADYLLDGMQRMTTLYAALAPAMLIQREGGDAAASLPKMIEGGGSEGGPCGWEIAPARRAWEVVFRVEDETFADVPPDGRLPPGTVPLSVLLDTFQLQEFRRHARIDADRKIARRIDDLQAKLRDYQVPVIPLLHSKLEDAIESFRRVNTRGTRMGETDLLRALSWSKEFDLSQRLEPVRQRVEREGWGTVQEDLLVDLCKLEVGLAPYSYAPERFRDLVREDKMVFARVAEKAARAAAFLRDHCEVKGRPCLPYAFQLVLLAHVLPESFDEGVIAKARDWFWKTTWTGYFASQRKISLARKNLQLYLRGVEVAHLLDDDSVEAAGRFDFRRARDKALALLLARRSKEPEQLKSIGHRGAAAVYPLVQGLLQRRIAAGNVVIAADDEAIEVLRKQLLHTTGPRHPALLERHSINAAAHERLRAGDGVGFARARLEHLRDLEAAEVSRLSLRYIVADLPEETHRDGPLFEREGEDERDE